MKNLLIKIKSKMTKKQAVIILSILAVIVIVGVVFVLQNTSPYSLKESEIKIEVKAKIEDVNKILLENLQKNDKEISDEKIDKYNTNITEDDLSKLASKEIAYIYNEKEIATITVNVVDTTKPEIKVKDFEVEAFTELDKKTIAEKTEITISDNYDDAKGLFDKIEIKGYDSEKEETQTVTVSVKDSSGNEGSVEVQITVKKFEMPEDAEPVETPKEDQNYDINDVPYAPGQSGGGSSSGGNNGSMGNAGNNNGSGSSGGNSGSSGGGWTPPVEVPVTPPVTPPAACPGGMDSDLPCDWTPNKVGNGGLFNSKQEAEAKAIQLGLNLQNVTFGAVYYNDNSMKWTFFY